jgi:aspartyl-tRNA(Asn)/glutamyl-tRNA(Gln) amidotransferase subunit C
VSEPRITSAEVAHVARLARLALAPDELERMRGELDRILAYVHMLEAVDVEGVEPTSHTVALTDVARADEPVAPLPREAMLANAPDPAGELLRVPRIIEE